MIAPAFGAGRRGRAKSDTISQYLRPRAAAARLINMRGMLSTTPESSGKVVGGFVGTDIG